MAEIRHNQGEAGGYLVGNRHSEGGIKAVNKSTGQPLEMEGGEVVITRDAVSDPKKRSFNGKMMTNRQILSEINQSGGGVAFADGGDVPESMHFDADAEYEYGGDTMCGCDLATRMSSAKSYEDGGQADDDRHMALKTAFLFEIDYIGETAYRLGPKSDSFAGNVGFLVELVTEANAKVLADGGSQSAQYTADSASLSLSLKVNEKQVNLITGAVFDDTDILSLDIYKMVSYTDFLNKSYQEVVEDVVSVLRASQMDDWADIFYQENQAYFLGVDISDMHWVGKSLFVKDGQSFHNFITRLPSDTGRSKAQDELFGISVDPNQNAWGKEFLSVLVEQDKLDPFKVSNYHGGLKLQNQNHKEFTKFFKKAVKDSQVPEKDIKGVIIEGAALIASGSYNLSNKFKIYLDFSNLNMKPTWSWWKENFFEKIPFEVGKSGLVDNDDKRAMLMPLGNGALNFLAYEQDNVYAWARTKSDASISKLSNGLRNVLKDLPKLPAISNRGIWARFGDDMEAKGEHIISIPNAELEIRQPYQKQIEFWFKSRMQNVDNRNLPFGNVRDLTDGSELEFNALDPQVKRSAIYYGKDGVWCFFFSSTIHGKYQRSDAFINFGLERSAFFSVDEAATAKIAERKRLAKQKLDADKKAARDAAKAEKQRIKEITNRPYGVRDQPEDFSFLPFDEDKQYLNDETEQKLLSLQNEQQALKKMLKMATGIRNFEMRKAILKKLVKTQGGLEEIRLRDNFAQVNQDGKDAEKLMTPKGLMDYYFNQARQSPVKNMGDPCGLDTPTGAPSKLSIQAYYSVRTPYFKRWFGDWEEAAATGDYSDCSKMIDPETKEPRIMYHGVRRFSPLVDVANMGRGVMRPYGEFKSPFFPASYFGVDKEYVAFYAGMAKNQYHPEPDYEGFIYHVFLNLRNPVALDYFKVSQLSYADLLAYIAFNYGIVIKPSQNVLDLIANGYKGQDVRVWNYIRNDINLIAELKKGGFDGIIQVGNVPTFDETGAMGQDATGDEYLVFDANQVKSAVVKNSFYIPLMDDIRFKSGGYVRI